MNAQEARKNSNNINLSRISDEYYKLMHEIKIISLKGYYSAAMCLDIKNINNPAFIERLKDDGFNTEIDFYSRNFKEDGRITFMASKDSKPFTKDDYNNVYVVISW